MKTMLTVSVLLWLCVGVVAAFQRGDFADGNCATGADTMLVVVVGPLNYSAPETLDGTCDRHT